MVKFKGSLIFVFLLLISSITIFANEDAARIGDTFYAGRLISSEKVNVKGLDKTVEIDFLVGSNGYKFEISRLSPTNIELRIKSTEQTISVDLNQESELVLADGSKIFVKFTEYDRANSDIVLWAEPVGGTTDNQMNSENDLEDQDTETMQEENNEIATENNDNAEQESQDTNLFSKFSFNLTWLWIASGAIVILAVLFGSIWYFKKNPPKAE